MKTVARYALTLALLSLPLIACGAPTDEDTESAEGAATNGTSETKVKLCGDEVVGCVCPAKSDVRLSETEREACTLVPMRDSLRGRAFNLLKKAVGLGLFPNDEATEATIPGTTFKLREISVDPASAATSVSMKLNGSFSAGDPAAGDVDIRWAYVPVKISFRFSNGEDELSYTSKETYQVVPFFRVASAGTAALSVGSLFSKYGKGPFTNSLLAELDGRRSAPFTGQTISTWRMSDYTRTGESEFTGFDADILKNVLTPLCRDIKKANPKLKLTCTGTEQLDARTQLAKEGYLADRKLLGVEACSAASGAESRLSFVAPKVWGYASGQKAFLYARKAPGVWERDVPISILGIDTQKCGNRALKIAPPQVTGAPPVTTVENEVCVHAKVSKVASDCASIGTGDYAWGVAQTTSAAEDKTIQYKMP